MVNKIKNYYIEILLGVLFLAVSIYSVYYTIGVISTPNATTTSSASFKLKEDIYNQISNPANFGTAVSLDEAGFGKADPFAPL